MQLQGTATLRSRIADRAPRSPTFVSTTRYIDDSTHRGSTGCHEPHSSDKLAGDSMDVRSTGRRLREIDLASSSPNRTVIYQPALPTIWRTASSRYCTRRGRKHSSRAVRENTTPPAPPSCYRAAIKVSRTRLWIW